MSRGAPSRAKKNRDGFANPRQGDDEDWDFDAKIDIPSTNGGPSAVATTHGDVAIANSRGKSLDVHELLKREVFASPSVACDDHFEKSRPCPDAPWGFSDQYIVLDSWEADQASSDQANGLFSWNFNVQGSTGDQAIGVKDKLDNIVEIQLGSFLIPNITPGLQMENPYGSVGLIPGFPLLVPSADYSEPNDPLSATFGYLSPYIGRITIEMKEIGLQSISQRKGVRYHYEADVISVYNTQGTLSTSLGLPVATPLNPFPSVLRVVPLDGFDTYQFTEPIQDVHGLSLQIRAVDGVIPFPLDVISGVQAYTNAAIYPYLGLLLSFQGLESQFEQTFLLLSYLVGKGRISVSGLSTANVAINNWINQAPSLLSNLPPGGAPGIGIAALDSTVLGPSGDLYQFGLVVGPYVDVTPLVPTIPAAGVYVQIPSATTVTVRLLGGRVRIPMRLRRVVQRTTNYS